MTTAAPLTPTPSHLSATWGICAGLAAGALWGLVFVAPLMAPQISALDFTAARFVSYGVLSLSWLLLKKSSTWPTAQQALTASGLSVLGFTGYYLLLILAVRDAGIAVPSLIIGTIPVWMMLLGKPARLRWSTLLPALLLTLLGLALMLRSTNGVPAMDGPPAPHFWRGVAVACLAMGCWTAFGLINACWLKKHPQIHATTWASWLGLATGLGALLLWLLAGTPAQTLLDQAGFARAATLAIVTGAGSAWLATILWNIASQRLSASLCGQLIVSETIFALMYAWIWDGRWPTAPQGIACLLFITGIFAAIRAHR